MDLDKQIDESTYHIILNFTFSRLRKIFQMKCVNADGVFSCNYEYPLSKQNIILNNEV